MPKLAQSPIYELTHGRFNRLTVAYWRAIIDAAVSAILAILYFTFYRPHGLEGIGEVLLIQPVIIAHPIVMFALARGIRRGSRSAGLTLVIITFIKAFGWGFGAIVLLTLRTPLNNPDPSLSTAGGILVTALVCGMVVVKFTELVIYLMATTRLRG